MHPPRRSLKSPTCPRSQSQIFHPSQVQAQNISSLFGLNPKSPTFPWPKPQISHLSLVPAPDLTSPSSKPQISHLSLVPASNLPLLPGPNPKSSTSPCSPAQQSLSRGCGQLGSAGLRLEQRFIRRHLPCSSRSSRDRIHPRQLRRSPGSLAPRTQGGHSLARHEDIQEDGDRCHRLIPVLRSPPPRAAALRSPGRRPASHFLVI